MTPLEVNFEILLRTAGKAIIPTTQNIAEFRPDAESLEKCRRWLSERGVRAHATGFSVACSAPVSIFEALFGVKLVAIDAAPGCPPWRMVGSLRVPTDIAALVEDVTLPPAPEFF